MDAFVATRPGALAVPREIPFEAADFERVRSLIRAKAGIDLHPGKQNLVYGRLARRLREHGHASFRSYLDALQSDSGPEWQAFINCLTTNLTAFFREAHHFETLAQALPKLAGPVRIWSCAASTGEEPYSIAMTALEALGASAQVRIDASDIDTQVLETARAGVYPLESAMALGDARLRRFFLKGRGVHAGKARVSAELQKLVSFRPFNLLATQWERGVYDAVFCRNVMIYFDRPTQRQVLARLHAALKPGGLLFAGHAENFTDQRDLFELAGKTVYRRAG
ncbi:methyltransferase domain-containing protein [Ramlibacter sp. G-1-2-2]|uniref:Chemotaxis protein methyltransferase n=1 Tax=Ramlibacter agri TaxID=2728837 RepID=A0A848GXK4_9BURK|nr:CheR family methyltransferase [Ramlibacter agri]NML43396.1 methyltransferase domain-containing protein [Ramlibacter agri]